MPAASNTINLIRTKTSGTSQYDPIFESLRKSATVGLWLFLVASMALGGVYYYFYAEQGRLEKERAELYLRVNQAKNKEGLLISIKERTKIVDKVLAAQKPWADMLDLLGTVVVPPQLSSISVDEQNEVVVGITGESIDDIVEPMESFIAFAQQGKIRNPKILSVQFDKDGSVTVSLAFTAPF